MPCLCKQLKTASLLAAIPSPLIDRLAGRARLVTLKGRYGRLVTEDLAQRLYFVVAGEMRLYRTSPDGQDLLLQRFRDSEFFCLASLVSGRSCPGYAVNVGRTDLLYWERAEFLKLVEAEPQFSSNVLAQMGRQIERERELRLLARCGRADVKVAAYLIHRMRSSAPRPGGRIDLRPISLTAEELGMARETLSRSLRRLAGRNAISCQRGQVAIVDQEALVELLEEGECVCREIA